MHKRLEHIKETLMCCIESQLTDLAEVDTKELGEAIDMIKDLEEAIYYCTVTEAMKSTDTKFDWEGKKSDHHQTEGESRMYYDGYKYPNYMYSDGETHHGGEMSHDWSSSGGSHIDHRNGRSYASRKMYMEAKEMQKDKAIQLRELEKYMQELTQDITEMIGDSTPEEKQYLEKKISALATKIGQMK